MRERPILFSGPMVRALLDGRKTQTRRAVRWPAWSGFQEPPALKYRVAMLDRASLGVWPIARPALPDASLDCPYGAPGDQLWVRETWAAAAGTDGMKPRELAGYAFRYAADPQVLNRGRWRPSIHMPRWAARLVLEVLQVRVQRLQDITEEDARAEGVGERFVVDLATFLDTRKPLPVSFRLGFEHAWNEINGERAPWSSNPWVWAITFRRVQP